MGGTMKVDFDGARRNLATAYNELASHLKEGFGDGSIELCWPDELAEKLEAVRTSVGLILLLQDEDGEFAAMGDEIDRLEDSDLEG